MEEQINTNIKSYLSFKLGEEVFAAGVKNVLNILEMVKITEVPKAPDYMKGVINLRGAVLPVIDTRIKFGMEESEFTKDTCIVVCEVDQDGEEVKVGAIVDAVKEVIEIDDKDILPPPGIGNKYKSEFITGVIHLDEQFILKLDMNKVFSTDELVMLQNNQNETNNE
ncbi:MAG: chemotaxis protein CheW [Marinilabiliales bacterium]|nr:MAG: chemotaxis protein CheW [Marinilabiliales bacterium]